MARLSAVALVLLLATLPSSADAATKRGVSAKVARKTLTIKGSGKADKITLRAGRRKTLEVDVGGSSRAEFRFKRSKFRKIAISGGRGNDRITAGAETAKVSGDAGSDTLVVSGSARADDLVVARAGKGLRTRRGGKTQVDARKVESLQLNPLGGADTVTLDDLTGGGARKATVALGGDKVADSVVVRGGAGADAITVSGNGARFGVAGLGAAVSGTGVDPGLDRLTVDGAVGNDTISAAKLTAGAVALAADGGAGDDTVTGGDGGDALGGGDGNDAIVGGGGDDALNGADGSDTLAGGDGNDSASGQRGDDTANLGAGDDRYAWASGDGADRVDGQEGTDRMAVGATDGPDNFSLAPADGRLRIARDDATADAAGVEGIDLAPRPAAIASP